MATNENDDFWTKKIKRIFNILYDKNGDGKISSKDFDISFEKINDALGWKKEDDTAIKANDTLKQIWKELKKYADQNDDEVVSQEEWLKMWECCIQEEKQSLPEWQKSFMDLMFDVNDTSKDNKIDRNEYKLFWNKAYGIDETECDRAFDKISPGKLYIDKDDFEELWKEYFLNKDKAVKGNYLFGIPNFL